MHAPAGIDICSTSLDIWCAISHYMMLLFRYSASPAVAWMSYAMTRHTLPRIFRPQMRCAQIINGQGRESRRSASRLQQVHAHEYVAAYKIPEAASICHRCHAKCPHYTARQSFNRHDDTTIIGVLMKVSISSRQWKHRLAGMHIECFHFAHCRLKRAPISCRHSTSWALWCSSSAIISDTTFKGRAGQSAIQKYIALTLYKHILMSGMINKAYFLHFASISHRITSTQVSACFLRFISARLPITGRSISSRLIVNITSRSLSHTISSS